MSATQVLFQANFLDEDVTCASDEQDAKCKWKSPVNIDLKLPSEKGVKGSFILVVIIAHAPVLSQSGCDVEELMVLLENDWVIVLQGIEMW
ncbi:hypothetical protein JTE90_002280 [Oedothorax gibbosus]|uniref:Uncharacterized protein n=1 Tax=Oedothorax gibbosus TaxID=931172 RepID=A0AAV6UFS5_9ARAC|nr:hypothetical protein JTE90_002280 [Oedothorax gibbosus]